MSLGVATAMDGNLVDAFNTADTRMDAEKRMHKSRR